MNDQAKSSNPPSPTAYDDSFRTMLNDCRELIIPVVNEAFGESYTGQEEIVFGINEHFITQDGGSEDKRVTDSSFVIIRADGIRKRYHIECEEQLDSSILIRIFEYDAQIALDEGSVAGTTLTVSFPHSAVLALRYAKKSPDTMRIRVVTPGGETSYAVPIIKVQQYSLDEIFKKKLLFFLPFYIFSHESDLPECNSNEAKLAELTEEYRKIRLKLDELQIAGVISEFSKGAICAMVNHVLALIAQKYENVREGVTEVMGGKVLEYEAKTILNEGRAEGRNEGKTEMVLEMLKDKQPLDFIARISNFSKEKISEIGRLHGVL